MTLTSRQKSYFVAPYLFLLCCSTYFQSSLKSQPIFLLQLVWILTIHLLQQN